MQWFKDIISGKLDGIVDSVSSGLDSLFTSDEERLQAKILLQKELGKTKLDILNATSKYDAEITARWKSDNEHIITRLVRPVSFMLVLITFFIIAFADGNVGGSCSIIDGIEVCSKGFTINPAYVPVFEGLLYTMVVAYFGSRGSEKVSKILKKTDLPTSWR